MRLVQLPSPPGPDEARISGLLFTPDSRALAAVARRGPWGVSLAWWDLQRHEPPLPGPEGPDRAGAAEEDAGFAPDPALSPDGRFLAFVHIERGPEHSLRFADRSAPGRSRRPRRLTALPWENHHHPGSYLALQFSPDGRYLVAAVSADEDGPARDGVYRWSVSAILRGRGPRSGGDLLPEAHFFPTPPPDVWRNDGLRRSLAFSPDGNALAAGLWSDRVLCWGFPSGEGRPAPRAKARKRHAPTPRRLAFSPDGTTLAVAHQGVTLHDAATAAPRAALPAGPAVRDLELDPTGRVLATACGDPLVRWHDAASGAPRETFDWGIGPVTAVAFSPDGCLCAAAGAAGQVAVWDVAW